MRKIDASEFLAITNADPVAVKKTIMNRQDRRALRAAVRRAAKKARKK